MAVSQQPGASVVDIRSDQPVQADLFLVDTNVWYWLVYNRAILSPRPPQPYQLQAYRAYVAHALQAEATLVRSPLSFAEMASVAERTERDVYNYANQSRLSSKAFRKLDAERRHVVAEIELAWTQTEQLSQYLDVAVNQDSVREARALIAQHPLDGYDAMLLTLGIREGLLQVLTDDSDFASVPGITVFTANPAVIQEAGDSGRLIVR